LLGRVDKTEKPYLLWKKIKNLISELHWKVSSLVEIMILSFSPTFAPAHIVRKGRPLGKTTRRLPSIFSFYKFKEKLRYKCAAYRKKLLIVDESFTSCTRGVCGEIDRRRGPFLSVLRIRDRSRCGWIQKYSHQKFDLTLRLIPILLEFKKKRIMFIFQI